MERVGVGGGLRWKLGGKKLIRYVGCVRYGDRHFGV